MTLQKKERQNWQVRGKTRTWPWAKGWSPQALIASSRKGNHSKSSLNKLVTSTKQTSQTPTAICIDHDIDLVSCNLPGRRVGSSIAIWKGNHSVDCSLSIRADGADVQKIFTGLEDRHLLAARKTVRRVYVSTAIIRITSVIESISTKIDGRNHYWGIVRNMMDWTLCIAGECSLKNTRYGGNTRSLYHGVALQLEGSGEANARNLIKLHEYKH